MRTLEILPKQGVGPIRFGMTRAEVRKQLGPPDDGKGEDREWYLDDLAVDFDGDGTVEFVEIAESENYRATFEGECLHELEADAAVAHVSAHAAYDENDPELGFTYVFPELQLSLWRPLIPEPDQDPEDPSGRRFESVGVGRDGYFS